MGDVTCLTEGLINKGSVEELADLVSATLDSMTDEDFIVLNGPAILQVLVCGYVVKQFGRLKILRFYKNRYRQRIIEFKSTGEILC